MTDVSLAFDRAMGTVRRFDRVVLTIVGLFAVLLALVPLQTYDSIVFTLDAIV